MQLFFNVEADNLAGHLLSTRGQMDVDTFFAISGLVIYTSLLGDWPSGACRSG